MEATAKAEAIKVEADALKDNPGLLELRAIERWSGEMPCYIGSLRGYLASLKIRANQRSAITIY
jgi:hypothetical protein